MKRAPRYDLPKAAPPPLRTVQLFLNTADHEHGRELLGSPADLRAWFVEREIALARASVADVVRARRLREDIRRYVSSGVGTRRLSAAAARARLSLDFGEQRLVATAPGVDGALGTMLAIVYDAIRDGNWTRLKTCRNCGWAYWDESRNRSAVWCSMQLCGNRLKVRRFRAAADSAQRQ
jgi:predicted RNA-binding Zn ribbon-like protein